MKTIIMCLNITSLSEYLFFFIYVHFLGDLIQPQGFKYWLYTDNFQIYISIPDLSPESWAPIPSGLLGTSN